MRISPIPSLAGILAASILAVSPAQSQSLSLSGINIVGTDAVGNIVSAFWTTDHTPTPSNWFGVWTSATSGGAFTAGPTQNNLAIGLNVGANSVFAVADFEPLHTGPVAFVGFNLFFNAELAPRISFVTPANSFNTYTAIASTKATPTLLYYPLTIASGVTAFAQGDYSYSLTDFQASLGSDRVYATAVQADGYLDPEFRLGITVTSTVPEPGTYALMASGLIAIAGVAARRKRTADATLSN